MKPQNPRHLPEPWLKQTNQNLWPTAAYAQRRSKSSFTASERKERQMVPTQQRRCEGKPQRRAAGRNLTAVRSLRPDPDRLAGRRAAPPRAAAGSGKPGATPAACCRGAFRPARAARTCPAVAAVAVAAPAPPPPLQPSVKAPAPQRPPYRAASASEPRAAGILGDPPPTLPGPTPEGAHRGKNRLTPSARRAPARSAYPDSIHPSPRGAQRMREERQESRAVGWVTFPRWGRAWGSWRFARCGRPRGREVRASPPRLRASCLLAAPSAAPARGLWAAGWWWAPAGRLSSDPACGLNEAAQAAEPPVLGRYVYLALFCLQAGEISVWFACDSSWGILRLLFLKAFFCCWGGSVILVGKENFVYLLK